MLLGMYEGKTIFKNITIKHLGGKIYLALESLNLPVNFFMANGVRKKKNSFKIYLAQERLNTLFSNIGGPQQSNCERRATLVFIIINIDQYDPPFLPCFLPLAIYWEQIPSESSKLDLEKFLATPIAQWKNSEPHTLKLGGQHSKQELEEVTVKNVLLFKIY